MHVQHVHALLEQKTETADKRTNKQNRKKIKKKQIKRYIFKLE